ncbi:hypothetical protein INH39_26540 [Massilia violaceinigra]|uniref:Uncharacterized protein n=1 Tax=Massilia violaceinigra TaxID=2045208 RepID=A0ABY4A2H8_9BURK|nr:hypothetical protein [Massilia violaceinigra]UOD28960.1 hypothetical protein INH39_26540 [Massilia violaceinigra]
MKTFRSFSLLFSVVLLTACGGGGSGGSGAQGGGTAPAPVNPAPVTPPPVTSTPGIPVAQGGNVLFVGDTNNQVLAAFDTLAPVAANTVLSAKVLKVDSYYGYGMQLDGARNLLYIMAGDKAGAQIGVFTDARNLSGSVRPQRFIAPAIGVEYVVQSLFLDKANDRLYVGYQEMAMSVRGFMVLEHASTLSGTVAPSRRFHGTMDTMHFAIDTKRGLLYSKNQRGGGLPVQVHANIDKASGELPIAGRFNINGNISGLAIDEERDRLYVGANGAGVSVFVDVSKPDPASRIKFTAVPGIGNAADTVLAFDSIHDRLYAGVGSTAYVLEQASKLGEDAKRTPLGVDAGNRAIISGFAF